MFCLELKLTKKALLAKFECYFSRPSLEPPQKRSFFRMTRVALPLPFTHWIDDPTMYLFKNLCRWDLILELYSQTCYISSWLASRWIMLFSPHITHLLSPGFCWVCLCGSWEKNLVTSDITLTVCVVVLWSDSSFFRQSELETLTRLRWKKQVSVTVGCVLLWRFPWDDNCVVMKELILVPKIKAQHTQQKPKTKLNENIFCWGFAGNEKVVLVLKSFESFSSLSRECQWF